MASSWNRLLPAPAEYMLNASQNRLTRPARAARTAAIWSESSTGLFFIDHPL